MNGGLSGKLGSIALVTAVTVMIWAWAASETRETLRLEVDVRFSTTDSKRQLARPERPTPVRLEVAGSKRALRAFEGLVAAGPLELVAGVNGMPSAAGASPIDLATMIAGLPAVRDAGVSVVATEPKSVELTLVPLESRPVRLVPEIPGVATQGDVVLEPAAATAVIPSDLLPAGAEVSAIAAVDPRTLGQLEPGQRKTVEASIRLPAALAAAAAHVTFDPATVRVTFTPKVVERTFTLSAVPVQIAGIAAALANFRIGFDPAVLNDVVVSGPAEAIERIAAGMRVVAFVHLTTDELEAGVTEKPISLWLLPQGVSVTRVGESDVAQPMVELSVEPVAVATASP